MEEPILITVPYRGKDKEVQVQWQPMGYTHRFKVWIDEVELFLEPDEERRYRAVVPPEQVKAAEKLDITLVENVAAVLEEAFK